VEEGKEGLLVPAQKSDALADAMRQIASDSHLAASLSDQAARRSMEFLWEHVAEKYLALYQKMISESASGKR
jgi:glycosyltransferase involved in cell wall biosynthesis